MKSAMWEAYPGLRKAVLNIAYDNGAINRLEGESDILASAYDALQEFETNDLGAVSSWLSGLSEDDLSTVCVGEDGEMRRLMASAPQKTDDVLNACFEAI